MNGDLSREVMGYCGFWPSHSQVNLVSWALAETRRATVDCPLSCNQLDKELRRKSVGPEASFLDGQERRSRPRLRPTL